MLCPYLYCEVVTRYGHLIGTSTRVMHVWVVGESACIYQVRYIANWLLKDKIDVFRPLFLQSDKDLLASSWYCKPRWDCLVSISAIEMRA